ncbi:MAG: CoA-binding protein, partial [Candidatus Helarchaeota archaeon]
NARSIAVIGASRNKNKGAYSILLNLLKSKEEVEIYPVNPKHDEILGLRAYPSILAIPDAVDLAIFFINQREMKKAIDESIQKGVKAFLIESGGFDEVGGEGKKLADYIRMKAREHGILVWGPNCMGFLDTERLTTTFMYVKEVRKGNVGIISQSGMLLGGYLRQLMSKNMFGFSKILTIGNRLGVNEIDALEFLRDDEQTRVLGIYLESISNGRKFLQLLREIAREKPIIILKGALTDQGKIAAKSHTASIAGKAEVFTGVLAQVGAIQVRDFHEFFSILKTFSLYIENGVSVPARSQGPQILTLSGGMGVVGSDLFVQKGFHVAKLTDRTLKSLNDLYPFWMDPISDGPVDFWPAVERNGIEAYFKGIDLVLQDPNVAGLLLTAYGLMSDDEIKRVVEIYQKNKKPLVALLVFGNAERFEPMRRLLETEGGIPAFSSLSSAVNALTAYIHHEKKQEKG